MRRGLLFFLLIVIPLITHSGKGDAVSVLSESLESICKSDLKPSELETLIGLTMEEQDEEHDPLLDMSAPYLFYEAKPKGHNLYSEVSLKTPRKGVDGKTTVKLLIKPELRIEWSYALTFDTESKGEISSDAGGRLTSIRYRVNGKDIVFSKKREADTLYRVIIKG